MNINFAYIPFTSKFNITVVDLTHINLATDDDIANSRDIWASFFTSTTWEELYMLAERNSIINNAIVHIAEVSDEEYARMQYEAREDQLMQERDMKMYYENEIATRDEAIATRDKAIATRDEAIATKDNRINSLQDELSSLKELVLSLQEEINNK